MKKARMNISHFRFILFNLKIFAEIVTTYLDIAQYIVLHPLFSTKAFVIKLLKNSEELVEDFSTSLVTV